MFSSHWLTLTSSTGPCFPPCFIHSCEEVHTLGVFHLYGKVCEPAPITPSYHPPCGLILKVDLACSGRNYLTKLESFSRQTTPHSARWHRETRTREENLSFGIGIIRLRSSVTCGNPQPLGPRALNDKFYPRTRRRFPRPRNYKTWSAPLIATPARMPSHQLAVKNLHSFSLPPCMRGEISRP